MQGHLYLCINIMYTTAKRDRFLCNHKTDMLLCEQHTMKHLWKKNWVNTKLNTVL